MGRIRTIKPEFPQSETMGKLSRDARLLFILLWTIVDDDGRCRAASRMLASLLYPYDDDAPGLIGDWLRELEREGCVRRYEIDNTSYLDIPNWLKHQKIDHSRPSKLPPFREDSRIVAKPREASRLILDQGPRIKDRDLERKKETEANASGRRDEILPEIDLPNPEPELGPIESAETEFWRLADSAQKKGIARSRLKPLVDLHDGDFQASVVVLRAALRTKAPSAYFGKVIANLREEAELCRGARPAKQRRKGVPSFVAEAIDDGLFVERHGNKAWRIGANIYDESGELIGW